MRLDHSFVVHAPISQAWAVLTDIERIAPHLPGAVIESVTQDGRFTGRVNVKVGPVRLTYAGSGQFREVDSTRYVATVEVKGDEVRGTGTASATISARMAPVDDGTRVDVTTELRVTGRAAQYGRGVMADIGNKLLAEFVEQLSADLNRTDGDQAEESAGTAPATGVPAEPKPEINLLRVASGVMLPRIGLGLGILVIAGLIAWALLG